MQYIQAIIFIAVTLVTFYFFFKKGKEIYNNIQLGRSADIQNKGGLKSMILLALGQKKMFQNMIPAVLHLCIYVAFVITQIELIEIFLDGFTGSHRMFFHAVQGSMAGEGMYNFVISFIEVLSVLALIATVIFLVRRNLLRVPRFVMPEMNGWPKMDGNIILYWEIFLVFCIFLMNGADAALYPGKYGFLISDNIIAPMLSGFSEGTLHFMERFGWWGHILGVLAFLNYIPYSKHLHIMLAFPNAYYLEETPAGKVENMPNITNEIKAMFDPNFTPAPVSEEAANEKFGAKDATDLTWKNLLDAYSCTECGRCTDACPANQTGKLLSPRKIMMDTRDRIEEIGEGIKKEGKEFKDEKALLGDYISEEEVKACTSCNACVQECPVSINPLNIILQLRRYMILEEAKSPEEWNVMFNNIENNMAPWQFSPMDRDKWKEELEEAE